MNGLDRRTLLGLGLAGSVAGLVGYAALFDDDIPEETVRRGRAEADVHRRESVETDAVELVEDGYVNVVDDAATAAALREETSGSGTVFPFETWAERECGIRASLDVAEYVREAFDRPVGPWRDLDFEFGDPIDDDRERGVVVEYVVRTRDGRVRSTPEVDFDALVAATPKRASATIEFEGATHEATFPVWVQRVTRGVSRPV